MFICIVLFTIQIVGKAALQKMLCLYIIFRSRLLVVTMIEMYSTNHAVSYKKACNQTDVNSINCSDLYVAIKLIAKFGSFVCCSSVSII